MTPDPWAWLGTAGGEVTGLMREVAWGATSVGPVEAWPPSLKGLVSMMLAARQPMFLWWGPDLVQFYNDGYVPSFGVGRHPSALGQKGQECWAEIWPIIGPEIEGVRATREATFHQDALVPIFRNGQMEEVYWTYGYSPVFETDGSVAGILVVVTETTSRVVALRRLRTAQAITETLGRATRSGELARGVVQALTATPEDAPWALVYRRGATKLVVEAGGLASAQTETVITCVEHESSSPRLSPDQEIWRLVDLSTALGLAGRPWPEASVRAVVIPLRGSDAPSGPEDLRLVLGLSPRLPFDDAYRDHLRGLSRQLAATAQRIGSQNARIAAEVARNDLLMQAPFAAALLVGPKWRYEQANPLYVRMVGREVVGRDWHDCFPELRGGAVDDLLARVYATGEVVFADEQLIPLVRESDGVVEQRFFDFTMSPIRSEGSEVDGMMVVAVEVTAKAQARRDLERTAAEREALVRDLEDASRAKDDFLAMLGHELRNPLSPIVTAVALMRRRGAGDTAREQAVISRQVTRMVRLVDDLLDVSRVTRGKIELRRATADVAVLVDHAVEMVMAVFEERQHRLDVSVTRGLRWFGDATRLEQVIGNLLTNAARYTQPGGDVLLSAVAEENDLVIRVKDNGEGLDPELLARLFEPFVQGRRGGDRPGGGLGLGLAVVKGLVSLHGGSVKAFSDGPGRGSEFVVRIPGLVIGGEAGPHPKVAASASASAPPGKRVLVVDDNEDAATLLAELLELKGHQVSVAFDGPGALLTAETFHPHVALLDVGLPGMDGYQLLAALRDGLNGKPCRFLALTGYGQPADVQRAAEAGFERLLVKPVDVDLLERLLGQP